MMKTLNAISAIAILLTPPVSGFAQSDLYSVVTNLWWEGPKTNVLSIAESRLAADTNDIVGIVLRLECDLSFGDATSMSNSLRRFVNAGHTIETSAFRVRYPLEAFNVAVALESLPPMSAAEWTEDRAKGLLVHKSMILSGAWNSLRDDGWLVAPPPSNGLNRVGIEDRTPILWRNSDIQLGKMLTAYMVCCAARTDSNLNSAWESLRGMTDSQMLAVAQQRLDEAPTDLFGATTSLFYHFKRCDPSTLSNTVDRIAVLSNEVARVLQIGASETRHPFADHWPWMSVYLENVQIWLSGTNAPAFEAALHYGDLHSGQ